MTRVLLTDMPSYQLRPGDKVVSQKYDASKNTVMFSILRKTGEAKPVKVPKESRWTRVYGSIVGGHRVRLTAPDGSCVIEYDSHAVTHEKADARRMLLGAVELATARRNGWIVEVRS